MSHKHTGVFATAEEIDHARALADELTRTPVIRVHGHWLPEDAHHALMSYIDKCAVKHGLPEPEKDVDGNVIHYGMLSSGEFTTVPESAKPL
jgi:hypothetical protein